MFDGKPRLGALSVVVISFMGAPLLDSSELDSIIVAYDVPSLTLLREGASKRLASGGTLRKGTLSIEWDIQIPLIRICLRRLSN